MLSTRALGAGKTVPRRVGSERFMALVFCMSLLAAALSACGDAAMGAAESAVTRDSAGVRIVESSGPAWGESEGWSLSAAPTLEIGMAEGPPEYLLDRVEGARLLPGGRIVLANAGSQELRFYDGQGQHLSSVGGRGDGPGEYQNIDWLSVWPGDSLVVFDAGPRRLSILSPDGSFVRSVDFARMESGSPPRPLGAFADGTLLGRLTILVQPDEIATGMRASNASFGHFSGLDGAFLDTIATLPGEERHLLVEPTMLMVTTPLLSAEAHAAVSGDEVFLAHGGEAEVAVYAPDGTLRRLIRPVRQPVPVTAAEVTRLTEERLGQSDDENYRRQLSGILESMPPPAVRPAFAAMLVDDEANLWLEETALPGEPNQWTVFDAEGRMLGAITLPDRFRPTHIGDDFVLGVVTDELDVQRLRKYTLTK